MNNFNLSLIIISFTCYVFAIIRSYQFANSNLKASRGIFEFLMKKIFYSDIKFFETNEIGNIINRLSNDTISIDSKISFEGNILLKTFFSMLGSLIVIIY